MIYAYTRVSTEKQNLKRQIINIKAAMEREGKKCDQLFSDKWTGTDEHRPGFDVMKKIIQAGDTIIFDSVSRMSRDADAGFKQYMEWYDMGVNLVFLNEPTINTDVYRSAVQKELSPTGDEVTDPIIEGINKALKVIARKQIKIAFEQSQKERDDLSKRTKDGMAAKGCGNLTDKATKAVLIQGSISKAKTGMTYNVKTAKKAKDIIRQHSRDFDGDLNDTECMKLAGCSRNTLKKYKAELMQEGGAA